MEFNEWKTNSFIYASLTLVEREENSRILHLFTNHILVNREFAVKAVSSTAADIYSILEVSFQSNSSHRVDFIQLKKVFGDDKRVGAPLGGVLGMRPTVPLPPGGPLDSDKTQQLSPQDLQELYSLFSIKPVFVRPAPPLTAATDQEIHWINIDDAACLTLGYNPPPLIHSLSPSLIPTPLTPTVPPLSLLLAPNRIFVVVPSPRRRKPRQ